MQEQCHVIIYFYHFKKVENGNIAYFYKNEEMEQA